MDFLITIVMFLAGIIAGWLARSGRVSALESDCKVLEEMWREQCRKNRSTRGWITRKGLKT